MQFKYLTTSKRYIVASIVFGLILSAMYISLDCGWAHLNNPSVARFPVRGIDVSHHQQAINWAQLPQQQARFVFIKATEGGDFKDTRFTANWQGAKQAGIPHGAYHYFNYCKSGWEQAQNFISVVPVEDTSLPPVIDLEPGPCEAELGRDNVVAEVHTMLQLLQQAYHKTPILYIANTTYYLVEHELLKHYPLWVRDIYSYPTWAEQRWLLWQYDSRTRLAGINTFVDMNVFSGTPAQFQQWLSACQ